MLTIKIKFLGILSDYAEEISLDVKEHSNLSSLRIYITTHFSRHNLNHLKETIAHSIFSNEHEILHDTYILTSNATIYLLPPFSGG